MKYNSNKEAMTKTNGKVSNIHWKQNMKPSKFLLCPNCKSNIPQLKIEITPEIALSSASYLLFPPSIFYSSSSSSASPTSSSPTSPKSSSPKPQPSLVSIEISCICQSKTITMPLKSFLSQSKEASSPPDIRCVLHSKPSNLFCIECSYWLCQDCIYLHQLCQGKSGKDHLITSTQVNIYCQLHQVKFYYYCKECNMNICRQCHSNDHLTHSVILLKTDNIGIVYQNLVSIDEVLEKNNDLHHAITERFKEERNENIASISDMDSMEKELFVAFIMNKEINELLKEFYSLYYQTARTLVNYPCYELMHLHTTLNFISKQPREDPRNIYKAFKYQYDHFMLDFIIKQARQYDCIDTIISHTKEVSCLVKLDNDLIASGSHDSTVKLWSIKDNMKLKTTLRGKKDSPIISIIQMNNGILFTSTSKDEYLFYDMSNYAILNPSNKSYQETKRCSYPMLQLSNDQLVTRQRDDKYTRYDDDRSDHVLVWRSHDDYFILIGHKKRISHLIELNNSNILSVSYDSTMRIWEETKEGYQLNSLIEIGKVCLTCIIKLSNGKLVSDYEYSNIKIWNYPVMNSLAILVGHSSLVNVLLELKNGLLASGSKDKTIRLWDLDGRQCVMTLTGHSKMVNCLVQVNDRMLLSGSQDKTIKIWNLMDERKYIPPQKKEPIVKKDERFIPSNIEFVRFNQMLY